MLVNQPGLNKHFLRLLHVRPEITRDLIRQSLHLGTFLSVLVFLHNLNRFLVGPQIEFEGKV